MSPFKISFSKLLRSTAMTLLFIPGVSAMEEWEDHRHLLTSTSPTEGSLTFSKRRISIYTPKSKSPSPAGDYRGPASSSEGRESIDTPKSTSPSPAREYRGPASSSEDRASPSFTHDVVERFFGDYVSNRLNVGNTKQYEEIHMPQAPVVHPYGMADAQERKNYSKPAFPYAARLSARELGPNLFPALALSEAESTLRNLGIDPKNPEMTEYFIVVQDDPWNNGPWFYENPKTKELVETKRLLRPQSWAFPEAPDKIESAYSQAVKINVAIFSPNNDIALSGLSEGVIHSHNGINEKNPNGDPTVVSSGPAFPMFSGLKANETSFFVSTVVIPATKKAAVTFHTILDDRDFGLLQRAEINTLRDLQDWLGDLFQSKYRGTSDASSPYSSWTTRAGFAASVSSSSTPAVTLASSSSTPAPVPAPVVPALELDTPTFHMGRSNPYPTTGFSAFEGTHRWTVGEEATITLPLKNMEPRPTAISFLNTGGFVTAAHPQHLTIKVNEVEVAHHTYTLNNNNQIINFPLPQDDQAVIKFVIPNAKSPLDLGIGADNRKLGILFKEVQFTFE